MFGKTIIQEIKSTIPEGPARDIIRFLYRGLVSLQYFLSPKNCVITKSSDDGSYLLKFKTGILQGQNLVLPPADYLNFYSALGVSREVLGYFQRIPNSPDLVMDIGSYPGDFAVLASIIFKIPIYAFEPDPVNFQYLQETIRANKVNSVTPLNLGISDMEGRHRFITDGLCSRICPESGIQGNIVDVELTTIDAFMREHQEKTPFIKMDIEGHEIEAVKASSETLKDGSSWSVASYHLVDGEQTCHTLKRFFQARGYQIQLVYPNHLTLNAWKE